MIYHYLDHCCRIKLFIASENSWPLNFLSYYMFLDTTSVKNLSETLDFWVITIICMSVFTSLSPRDQAKAGYVFFFKGLFFVVFGFSAEQWHIQPQMSSLCSGLNHGGSSSKPIEWPKSSACCHSSFIYVLGVWLLSCPYIMLFCLYV